MWRIRILLKKMNAKKSYLMVIALISIFIVVGYFSYAMFTVNKEQKEAIRIITGTLTGELKVDNVEVDRLVVNQGETKEFTITLRNNNDRTARYLLYYIGTLPSGLEAGYVVEDSAVIPPENNGRNITVGTIETYKIKVKNNTTSSQTIQLKFEAGLEKFDLVVPDNGHLFEKMKSDPMTVEQYLTSYTNPENAEFNDTTKDKMFVYHHEAGDQQENWTEEELTDYRYIGEDPNNYATFNNEEAGWRIIGVFTVENEKGEKEQRIKIIRNDFLKTSQDGSISWDNKLNRIGSSKGDKGSNNWDDARLMMLLNPGYENDPLASDGKGSLYWNRQAGKCPLGSSSATVDCDFTSTGLTPEAQEMIGDAKWYLGGTDISYTTTGIGLASHFYGYERGTTVYRDRPTSWIGKVGLIYPSDYGYATSGGGNMTKEQCLAKEIYSWESLDDCYNNDWIYKSLNTTSNTYRQWTLTPYAENGQTVFHVGYSGYVTRCNVYNDGGYVVRPVVYILSNIQITQGTGSQQDPFVFTK